MYTHYAEFDDRLKRNDFLKRHYECLPFIGEKYNKSRLLLIGESHYVPETDVNYVNRDDFYDISFDKLSDGDYKTWINTRNVFEYRVYDRKSFENFFSGPATEIARVINKTDDLTKDQKIDAMHQYAFMNYFKRPSFDSGKTIEGLTENDYKYAYDISCYIIEQLNPSLIIFLSKKAYDAFYCSDEAIDFASRYNIKCVSHPSSCWWNKKRTSDDRCARQDFHDYIESHYERIRLQQ